MLLAGCDKRLGLIEAIAASLRDKRSAERVIHGVGALVEQRVCGMACGYEDCNDSARLAGDPVHRLLPGRDPRDGEWLASQPTLSRFENAIDSRSLVRMGRALADRVIERHRRRLKGRVRRITIDLDPTDHATHGEQQLALFNGHYGHWCYLPLAGFFSLTRRPSSICLPMCCVMVSPRRRRERSRCCAA